MIARVWSARATPEGAGRYGAHFRDSVLPELRSLAGFHAAHLMRRPAGDAVEIQVVTLWASIDAVGAFAGDPPDLAVVEPAARAALLDFDLSVRHYDVDEFR